MGELLPAAEADDSRGVDVAGAVAGVVAVEEELAALELGVAVVDDQSKAAGDGAGDAEGDVCVRYEGLSGGEGGCSETGDGGGRVLRVTEGVGSLDTVDDHAFAGDAGVELIDALTCFDHEVGDL